MPFVAEFLERVANQRVVDRQDHAEVRADPRDLLDHDGVGNRVHPRAPVLDGDRHAGKPELARGGEQVSGKLSALVDGRGARPNHVLGEFADRGLKELLLIRELQVHGRRSI